MIKAKAETAYLLEAAFGPELPCELVPEWSDKLGYHNARGVVFTNGTAADITPDRVKTFIRECLFSGLGEWPLGWSLGPAEASSDDLALIVWTLKPEAAT